ncbi:hypothetical protein [Variovorax sp. YR752]|uniref:hypothetical protein n=1 Tax=Variovorax sp. YR752 TaxID=1884383 RepID=UPI0031382DE9
MKLITPALVVAAAMAAYAPVANAGSTALVLNRTTLTNVNDAAGLWQHEGGNVFKGGVKVGQYALQRRVTTGGTTAPLNTAATTITLFFATAAGSAPQNVVLQGAHDFGPGNFRGAVSAASNRFNWIQGGDATYTSPAAGTISLVISWAGASQLTLP